MAPECLPPNPQTHKPSWTLPPGSTDCHFHIHGPYDRYPLAADRGYSPPAATVPEYQAMARTVGLERMVIVQPSTFGTDNRCTLDAVALLGTEATRAVVVVDPETDLDTLRQMHAQGARGIRFNAVNRGTPRPDAMKCLADKLAALGWHMQIYAEGEIICRLAPVIETLPVAVVLDHLAGVSGARGVGSPECETACALLRSGKAYVKLSGYRSSAQSYPYDDVAPIARAFIAAAPAQCVWGSDWPHPNLFPPTQMPDDGQLLDLLAQWAPDPAVRKQILVDNPARLYGFGGA